MSLLEIINEMPMFEKFSEKEKKMFADIEHTFLEFKKGERILSEGDAFRAIYLLVKGSVLVYKTADDDTQIRLAKLRPGEIFGEMSFFSNKPRHSNIMANENVLVIKMDENFFEKINPGIKDKIKDYFIDLLINRLDDMNKSIMNISKLMRH